MMFLVKPFSRAGLNKMPCRGYFLHMWRNIARKIFLLPVKGYQKLISPYLGRNCIYSPTCSEYFVRSVMKFGIFKGTVLGLSRIFRCSRLYYGGPDDIPNTFSFRYMKAQRIAFRRHGKALFR